MRALLSRIPSWAYLTAVLAGAVAWGLMPHDERPVNPDVFDAVNSIIELCRRPAAELAQQGPQALAQDAARCDDVRYLTEWCGTRGQGTCSVSKVYDTMVALGYHLPPLHRE
jgi:hypothetical protein